MDTFKNPEYRGRCSECNWDGLKSELGKFTFRFREFPICPKCGARWNSREDTKWKRSSITYYGREKKEV